MLVGPDWNGEKPAGFIDVLHSPIDLAGSSAAVSRHEHPRRKARARAVLNQIGMVPLSRQAGPIDFDCEARARNKVFPPGLTEQMVAADPICCAYGRWMSPPSGTTSKSTRLQPGSRRRRCTNGRSSAHAAGAAEGGSAWKALIDHTA